MKKNAKKQKSKVTQLSENFSDIATCLCRGLIEGEARLVCIRLCLLGFHLALGLEIGLVACQCNHNVGICLPLKLLDPRFPLVEGVLIVSVQGKEVQLSEKEEEKNITTNEQPHRPCS